MSTRTFFLVFAGVSLLLAGVVSSYASGHPDGLMYVARTQGFDHIERASIAAGSPFADYSVAGIGGAGLSRGLAGVLGCALTFVAVLAASSMLTRRRTSA